MTHSPKPGSSDTAESSRATEEPKWLDWSKRLQTMAQNGLHYARDRYDIARYQEIAEIACEMMAAGSETHIVKLRGLFSHESGHATPKVDVRVAAFRESTNEPEILLVREKSDGLWTLPGGWADVGETPSASAAREVLEESGFEVRITRLLAVYDRNRHGHPFHAFHIYKIFFEGEITGGHSAAGDGHETDAVDFFPATAVPPLSLGRTVPEQVQRMFELHAAGPGAPADFD
jgi:ADP-ribose pyrophosphatase YjhB (NUDIX family)